MSEAARPTSPRRWPPLPGLWIVVLVQTAAHLAMLRAGGFISDTRMLQQWAETLASRPVSQFYERQPRADHLPGDLWILKLEAWVYHAVSGHSPSNAGFLNALKLGPGLADVGIAVALYLIAREINGERAGRAAALLFAINPAPILISMVWGVADAVSMFFALVALLFALQRRLWAALPVLAFACLVKPQLGALAPLILIFWLRETWRATGRAGLVRMTAELVTAGAASLAVVIAAIAPFHVSLPLMNGRWSLISRIQYSADLYKRTTLNALNLWALFASGDRYPGLNAPTDQGPGFLGLSDQRWGILLTAIACVVLALPLIRKGGKERLIVTSMAALFAIFMLQTRMHERYFFPAVALMAAAAALRPRWIPLYAAMSGVYFIEVLAVYRWLANPSRGGSSSFRDRGNAGHPAGYLTPNEVRVLVAVNLGLLAIMIVHALLDFRNSPSLRTILDDAPSTSAPLALAEPRQFTTWPQH